MLASYDGLRKAPDAGDPEVIPTRERLGIVALEQIVRLYDAWGQPRKADSWRKELAAKAGSADEAHTLIRVEEKRVVEYP